MRLLNGPSTIYYYHKTVSPGTMRFSDNETYVMPSIGDTISGQFGLDGADIVSTVADIQQVVGINAYQVTLVGVDKFVPVPPKKS